MASGGRGYVVLRASVAEVQVNWKDKRPGSEMTEGQVAERDMSKAPLSEYQKNKFK